MRFFRQNFDSQNVVLFPVPLGLLDFLQVRADFRLPLKGIQKLPPRDTIRDSKGPV